jgi:aminoglycoside phosphotransferase (APT) family kinase protein
VGCLASAVMTDGHEGAADRHDLAHRLEAVLTRAVGGPFSVSNVRRLAGGSSCETWGFEAASAGAPPRRLVLRLAAPGAGRLGTDLGREARLLSAAGEAGAPVPTVVAVGDSLEGSGGPFLVMDHVEGETIPRRILRDGSFVEARRTLVVQCARALARIHSIPPDSVESLPGGDQLAQLSALYRGIGAPHPVFDVAIRWLAEGKPTGGEECVVHGDFRLGNVIVGQDGLRAVLDWELAHRGDPVEDLGWMCVKAWRFGEDKPVAGLSDYDELTAAYEEASGRRVDPHRLAWWQAVGTLRWGVVCLLQVSRHLSGVQRSVEFAAIGRRVCEVEWDLLDLMEVPRVSIPAQGEQVRQGWAPQDPPEVTDLLDVAAEFLRREAVPALSGRTAFHARVAANVVAMAAREIREGAALEGAHGERLRRLGVGSEAELCAAIGDGAFDDRGDELGVALRQTVAAKLAVANPRYATEPQ